MQMRICKSSVIDVETDLLKPDQALVRELQFPFFENANQNHNETFLEEMKERRLKGKGHVCSI